MIQGTGKTCLVHYLSEGTVLKTPAWTVGCDLCVKVEFVLVGMCSVFMLACFCLIVCCLSACVLVALLCLFVFLANLFVKYMI